VCDRELLLSRRQLLRTGGFTAAAAALPLPAVRRWTAPDTETVTLTATVVAAGTYTYLPFQVPPGVNRVAARLDKDAPEASVGVGLFDQHGPQYQSDGFRGVYGAERAEFFVAADAASTSFLPGAIVPGEWTVVVPVFQVPRPTTVTVTVTLTYGRQRPPFRLRPPRTLVDPRPGWYRGDLHCHTPESSDAWASGTAMDPAEWARTFRDLGLDFAAMTDHNVVSQNLHLARDAVPGVLLLAGEEMTNWFHGHATVSGLVDPTGWLDWRQRPTGVPLQAHEERLPAFLSAGAGRVRVRRPSLLRAPVVAVPRRRRRGPARPHPRARDLDRAVHARRRGRARRLGRHAPRRLADRRQRRQRPARNGQRPRVRRRHPHDRRLGRRAGAGSLVRALRAGRSFVTRLPDGVEVYLTAAGPGGQRQIVGGTVHGEPGDVVHVEALVRRAAGAVLTFVADGAPVRAVPVTRDEEVATLDLPIGTGGYVRAEVRRTPTTDPSAPLSGHTGMEALTNPIWLVAGPEPEDNEPVDAPPPAFAHAT
jgi:hypothetical protein